METLNKEFWEKRDAAMKRFMASKVSIQPLFWRFER